MKLLLLNTASGLKPMYDEDYEEKKLKIGEVYQATIKTVRNYELHKNNFRDAPLCMGIPDTETTELFQESGSI